MQALPHEVLTSTSLELLISLYLVHMCTGLDPYASLATCKAMAHYTISNGLACDKACIRVQTGIEKKIG